MYINSGVDFVVVYFHHTDTCNAAKESRSDGKSLGKRHNC